MSHFYWTGQRRPAAYQAPERSNNASLSNPCHRFERYGYKPSPSHRIQHTYVPQRRDAVAYDPAIHDQYAEAYYPQTSSTRPTNSQTRRHDARHDFDYQQYDSTHNDDSEGSSTAAVVGSRALQSLLTPPSVYHHPYNAVQTGRPYAQAIHSQHQQEPLMNHNVPYDQTAKSTPRGSSGLSYQHGGHTPMNPNTSFMPNPGLPPAEMYAPASAFPPMNHSSVPIQPPNVNALYPAGYQRYPQPPQNDQPRLSNTAVNQDRYPQANSTETMVNSTSIAPEATRPPKKNHGGKKKEKKGKGKVRIAREEKAEGRLG